MDHIFYCPAVEKFVIPERVIVCADGQAWGYCPCCDTDARADGMPGYDPTHPQPHPGIHRADAALVARYEAMARAAFYRREAERLESTGRPTSAEIARIQAQFYVQEAQR